MAKKPLKLKKEHKSEKGGLTEKGRKYINAKTGSKLKAPVSAKEAAKSPAAAKRRKSFCARMEGVKGPLKTKSGNPTRKKLALERWDCK